MPEWLKGTGCKPVGYAYLGSNPSAPTIFACVAQSVEHFLGKEEVVGSSPIAGSSYHSLPLTLFELPEGAEDKESEDDIEGAAFAP